MFPIILLIGSIGEYTTRDKDTQMLLVEGFINTIIPSFSQEFIEAQILNSAQNSQIGSLLGTIGLLITTLSVFSAIRNTFNYVWGIDHQGPSYITKWLIDIKMLLYTYLFISILVLLNSSTISFIPTIHFKIFTFPTIDQDTNIFIWIIIITTKLLFTSMAMYLVFRTALYINVKPIFIFYGSFVSSIGVHLCTTILSWYFEINPQIEIIYGSLQSVICLLTWSYGIAISINLGSLTAKILHFREQ
tara:strand:- start:481 stop:1218 length:738 start_codon:yes stop_codon:yes gene_type:complete